MAGKKDGAEKEKKEKVVCKDGVCYVVRR